MDGEPHRVEVEVEALPAQRVWTGRASLWPGKRCSRGGGFFGADWSARASLSANFEFEVGEACAVKGPTIKSE